MTLEKVQYTAKAHTTDDRDKGAFRNDWRRSLATSVAVAAFGLVLLAAHSYAQTVQAADARAFVNSPHPAKQSAAAEDVSIRPFHINVPEEELVDLHRRLAAIRWPDRETVTDRSQGVQLATMRNSCATGRPTTTGGRRKRS